MAQQELIRSGRNLTAENLQSIKQKLVKIKQDVNAKDLAEDEAIQYLTHLAKTLRRDKAKSNSLPLSAAPSPSLSPSPSPSPSPQTTKSSIKKKPSPPPRNTQKPSPPPRNTQKPKYTMELMAKENEREEALRKRWPDNLPWPTLDDCKKNPPPQYVVFTSTWLSVTAKKIK